MSKSETNMKIRNKEVDQTKGVGGTASSPKPFIRKLFLWTSCIMGLGYILPNMGTMMVLTYILSQFEIGSQEVVIQMGGTLLFLIASILLMVLGILIVTAGIRYYKEASCNELIFGGVMLASFYLLCLGIGSVLLSSQPGPSEVFLVISPVLIMVSAAVYMMPSASYKIVGSLLGMVSAALLATSIAFVQPLKLVFVSWNPDWQAVPFPGPFMSLALLEAIVVMLASIFALVYSLSSERKAKPTAHFLFSIIGLVYGISLFIGAFLLSFSFLMWFWKIRWEGPLFGLPSWVYSGVLFWSASLTMLQIGGFALILASSLGFISAAKEFSAG